MSIRRQRLDDDFNLDKYKNCVNFCEITVGRLQTDDRDVIMFCGVDTGEIMGFKSSFYIEIDKTLSIENIL